MNEMGLRSRFVPATWFGVLSLLALVGCSSSSSSTAEVGADAGDASAPGASEAGACVGSCADGAAGAPTCPTSAQKDALSAIIASAVADGDVYAHVLYVQKSSGGSPSGGVGGGFTIPFTSFSFPTLIAVNTPKTTCTTPAGGSASGCYMIDYFSTDSVTATAYVQPVPVTLSGNGGDVLVTMATQTIHGLDAGQNGNVDSKEDWTTEIVLRPPALSTVHLSLSGSIDKTGSSPSWPATWQLTVGLTDADSAQWPTLKLYLGVTSQQTQGHASVFVGSAYLGTDATGAKVADWTAGRLVWTGACQ